MGNKGLVLIILETVREYFLCGGKHGTGLFTRYFLLLRLEVQSVECHFSPLKLGCIQSVTRRGGSLT